MASLVATTEVFSPCRDSIDALAHEPAVGDDHHVVDGLLDLAEHVAGDEDGLALTAEVAQELPQPPDALGVQPVGRLVQQEHLRVAQQRRGEPEALAHAHGVAAGPLARRGRDADQLEHLVDAGGADAGRVGEDAQVVAAGAAGVEVRGLQRGARRPSAGCSMST